MDDWRDPTVYHQPAIRIIARTVLLLLGAGRVKLSGTRSQLSRNVGLEHELPYTLSTITEVKPAAW